MTSLRAARITGTGAAAPPTRLTNDELTARLAAQGEQTSDAWIRERSGIQERRVAVPGEASQRNSALAAEAARRALEMAEKRPEDVQLIVFATCTPDTLIPATGCWLQEHLGARNAFAMDLNAACSGFVFGLSVAEKYVRCGAVETALVVGSDVLSAFTDWSDRTTSILFGDASGAAVVEAVPEDAERRLLSFHLRSDGALTDLFHIPAGGSALEVTPERYEQGLHKMHMQGREIFKIAVKTLSALGKEALDAHGLSVDDLDWFVPHQANLRIVEAAARRLRLPMEKVVLNVERFGNTSAATVPTALDEAVRDGRIQPGQLVMLDVFGAGMTCGSVLMRW